MWQLILICWLFFTFSDLWVPKWTLWFSFNHILEEKSFSNTNSCTSEVLKLQETYIAIKSLFELLNRQIAVIHVYIVVIVLELHLCRRLYSRISNYWWPMRDCVSTFHKIFTLFLGFKKDKLLPVTLGILYSLDSSAVFKFE